MFSYLSRGYGTYEGIAKLEKPDSALDRDRYNVLPAINKDPNNLYRRHFDYDGMYRIPQEQIKLPEMPKCSLNMPKTYSTKSGALLLYSEGCFVPGSRRLKKRPRFKRPKEKRMESMKDLMELIMKYKKNGCDPLFLEQLWRRASARDVQPGYSPNQYLSHLSHTTFDAESWKKLVETGSLKSFGVEDESFLPSLLPEYSKHLSHRPQPYKTMSLPPVSPSNSMVASFTFYQNAMSTGAASMVSLPSVNSESIGEQLPAKTDATAETLSARLAEVKSESGFKRDYDSLTVKEKEDVLTQLLMDVTLQNQGEVITVPTRDSSSTVDPNVSLRSNASKSLSSYPSFVSEPSDKTKSMTKETESSASVKSSRSDQTPTSTVASPSDHTRSVCSLPPIVLEENNLDGNHSWKPSLSSSGSGLSLVSGDLAVGLNSFDIEGEHDSVHLDGSDVNLEKRNIETRSIKSETAFSEHSLVNALDIQDAESLHHLTDEDNISLRSFRGAGISRIKPIRSDDGIDKKSGVVLINGTDQVEDNIVVRGDDDIASESDGRSIGDLGKDGVYNDTENGSHGDFDKTSTCSNDYSENVDSTISVGGVDYAGYVIGDTKETDPNIQQTLPTIDVVPPTAKLPHMSLTSLQDEVRQVASEVLSRPKSGRILAEDAHIAKFLLMERIEGLLAPVVGVKNVRASSAASSELHHLAQSRDSEILRFRRIRSAEATSLSRKPAEIQVQPVSGEERKQVEHVSGKDGQQVKEISEKEGKKVEKVVGEEGKQVKQVSSVDRQQAGQISDEEQTLAFSVGKQIFRIEERQVACEKVTPVEQVSSEKSEQVKLVANDEKEQRTEVDSMITVTETEVFVDTESKPLHETQIQSPHVSSAAPSPKDELLLTIKDMQPEKVKGEEIKAEEAIVEEVEESKQKISRAKKETKRGSVAKGKKKKPVVRTRIEPAKTPPFRAGLVRETKPPKGLEEKSRKARKGESDREASPDLQDEKTKVQSANSLEVSKDLVSSRIPGRIDSETGEVEHRTPSGKTPSLIGSRSPQSEEKFSCEDVESSLLDSEYMHETSPSVHDDTLSPRDETPSPRNKTPSARDQKACPRKNAKVTMESVETKERQPSPEVVLTEKERRARARAAQRAAAAERRRQEVERKRREREEARRRAQEEEERLEVLRKEAEEEMKRREEERKVQREAEERERMRVEAEQNERARQERLTVERQRQAREERQRKKEQLVAQRKFEEELRAERERIEWQIEEERRREYEEKIAHLAEEEQSRLLEERRMEEERIKREIQEEKERREEELRRMLEERQRMEDELAAARQRQFARRNFLETLLQDFQNLLLDQRVSRAYSFSYFDIMPWFKDRWRQLEEDRPHSKRLSTHLEPVPEESELDLAGEID